MNIGDAIVNNVLDEFGHVLYKKHMKIERTRRTSRFSLNMAATVAHERKLAKESKDADAKEQELRDLAVDNVEPPRCAPDLTGMKYKHCRGANFDVQVP
jgi:hypothetical protein